MSQQNSYIFRVLLFSKLVIFGMAAKEGLFPFPGGPFYGIPFKGNPLLNFIPFTLTGHCEANKTFVITSVDFSRHLYDLECIFAGSRTPSKVPQGSLFGTALTALNSPIFNPIIEAVWKGKHIKAQFCHGKPTFVGWNAFFNGPSLPFIPRIGPHNVTVAPAENDDGKGGLVFVYSEDVMDLCPELKEELLERLGRGGVSGANIWSKGFPFVDVLRYVGTQEDGGNLYLLKTYIKDPYREDKMATTAAFVIVLNYDEDAEPGAYFGIATEPLSKAYEYMFPGLLDMIIKGQPLDNLLLTPGRTYGQIRKGAVDYSKIVWTFIKDLPLSLRRIVRNAFVWMRMFRDVEAQRRSSNLDNKLKFYRNE